MNLSLYSYTISIFFLLPLVPSAQDREVKIFSDPTELIKKLLENDTMSFSKISLLPNEIKGDTLFKGDTVFVTEKFRLADLNFSYVTLWQNDSAFKQFFATSYSYYFILRKNEFHESTHYRLSWDLETEKIWKTKLGKNILYCIPSYPVPCNGSGCTMELDHLFILSNRKINYQAILESQVRPGSFCDLNHDEQPDYLSMGYDLDSAQEKISKSGNDTSTYFRIDLFTLKDNEWIPMTDSEGKPYFIFCVGSEWNPYEIEQNVRVLDAHWLYKF
ncbi:MAG TPA: hypothetical protein VE978_28005 [Chitinophagales bacterium]|nr:hypothetical protein [Chitinophagales bacterium]